MRIDDEIKKLIPPLKQDEYQGLEQKILNEGFKVPVVIWQEENILLDGHNRVSICEKHGIPYTKKYISLPSRESAINWVIDNQLSRRNLDPFDASILRGKKYLIEKQSHGGAREKASAENLHLKTREKIAKETGVSHDTIHRDAQLAEAVENLQDEIPIEKIKENPKKDIIELNKKPEEEKQAVIEIVKEKNIPIKKALTKVKIETARKKIAEEVKEKPNPPIIIHDDCKNFTGECDLLITDPPYMTDVDNINEFAKWLPEKLQCLKKTGFAFVFTGAYPQELEAYLSIAMPTQVLVWTYRNTLGAAPKTKYKLNWQAILFYRMQESPELNCPITNELWAVQDVNAPDGRHDGRYHAWEKPLALAERLIRHTTKPGDIILDCFAGTGTFLLAAAKLGRKAIGYEVNEKMINIAVERGCKLG